MIEMLKNGDVFTMAGQYKRRTLWQWLTRKPRVLQRFVVTAEVTVDGVTYYRPEQPTLRRLMRGGEDAV